VIDQLIEINFSSPVAQCILCHSSASLYVSLQYLMHVDVLPDDSLVIVERPLDAVLQSLPEPLLRKKFGV